MAVFDILSGELRLDLLPLRRPPGFYELPAYRTTALLPVTTNLS